MNRVFKVVAGIILLGILTNMPAFAAVDFEDEITSQPTVDMEISIIPTDDFAYDVEVYIGNMCYRIGPTYTNDRSYKAATVIEAGSYDLSVICPQDLEHRFSFNGPDHLDISADSKLVFVVKDGGPANNDIHPDDEGDGEKELAGNEGLFFIEPEKYHMAEVGEPSGKIVVKCEYCAAIKNVTYRLSGADKAYDIVLKRDSGFVAEAELPVGSYRETTAIDVELDEDVLYTEGLGFTWQHDNNPTFWGAYYEIEEDKAVEVSDLVVMMLSAGQVARADANVLFAPKLKEAYDDAVYENREELLETVPVIVETSVAPTIAAPEQEISVAEYPEEMTEQGRGRTIVLLIGALVVIVVLIIRKRRSLDEND